MRGTAYGLAGALLLFIAVWLAPAEFTSRNIPGYDELHAFAEMFAIVVAMLIFGVAWNAYSSERPGNVLILAGGFLAVGLIDFAHLLSWAGMPDLVTAAGHEKAINFHMAARLIAAGTLLAVALRRWPPFGTAAARNLLLAASVAVTGLVYWVGLYQPDLVPATFVVGQGPTVFKVATGYFIIAILAAAAWHLLRYAGRRNSLSALHLFAACVAFILSELCLTLYSDVSDVFNALGHAYKIAAYALIYRAVFVDTVRSPFERLARARQEIERANAEIRSVNAGLEQRVAERTAELSQANISLRDGAARIQSILDTVADGIINIDEHGLVETFNPAAERMFGYTAAEMIGRNVKMLMPEPYHSEHDGHLARYRGTGQARIIGSGREVMGRRKDGITFAIELSISEMRLHGERYFTGIVRDITERKNASEQLRKLSLAVEQSPESILITDLEGSIEYVNAGFVLATGFAREELLGKNPRVLQSGRTPPETYAALWGALCQGRSWKGELYNRRKDGTEYVELAAITPLKQPGGSISHYVAVKEDITERKRLAVELDRHRHHLEELVESRTVQLATASQEAEAANRAKSSFLATMSHEIRTPLGGLIGMMELLSFSPLSDEQRETLFAARDSGRSLLRILNDVLDWSKIEEGKLELAPQATSISALVADVANTYTHVASGNSVTLAQQVDRQISPTLVVDPLRLSQVLGNFVSNAIKFSRRGERVVLRAELTSRCEDGEEVRFSVKDTGIGIAPEIQSRLFQLYGQASADTARMYGGSGLGLAICRRLADLMGGRIDLESEPGRGSTFSITLTLPPGKAPAELMRARARISEVNLVRPLLDQAVSEDAPLVLVVDDHPINRKLLAQQLGLLGLRVESARDGKEALPLWRDGRFALVITDCHMPQLDGYELTNTIRKIEAEQARPRTPVFAWTANAQADEIGKCEAAGMDELLVKPVELAQLKRLVEKWLPAPAQHAPERTSETASPAAAAPPPLDFTRLTAMCGGKSAAVRESLLEFRRTNDQDVLRLRQAAAQEDLERVAHAAHRMLGSSSMVGAESLARACRHVDRASRAGDSQSVAQGMQVLESEVQRLNAYVDYLCAS